MLAIRSFGMKTVALVLALSFAPAATPVLSLSGLGVSSAQADPYYGRHHRGYRHHRDYRRHNRYGRHHRHHRRHRGGNEAAAAVIGGIVGLGVGAAIASQPRYESAPRRVYRTRPATTYYAAPRPWTGEWYRYCAAKFRSFDAKSGTYQPYNGPRRLCR